MFQVPVHGLGANECGRRSYFNYENYFTYSVGKQKMPSQDKKSCLTQLC